MKNKKNVNWMLGLDIGTNSVGWAVTDTEYNILKYKSNAMWGIHLFSEAKQSAERRGHRTARRLLARRKQRINMLQQFFAGEILKIDKDFFVRLKESALYKKDKTIDTIGCVFKNDAEYHKKYPTIHHLICDLMDEQSGPHDIRLVYMACAYILAHRGHFLTDVDKSNITGVTDFNVVFDQFLEWFDINGTVCPWQNIDREKVSEILKKRASITAKKKLLSGILKNNESIAPDSLTLAPAPVITLLAGGKAKLSELFFNDSYKNLDDDSISLGEANIDDKLAKLSSEIDEIEIDFLFRLKALYDWSLLTDILDGMTSISEAKKKVYESHRADLKMLKAIVKKYIPLKYKEIFKFASKLSNYTSYSGNTSSVELNKDYKKCSREDFYKYIKEVIKAIKPADENDSQIVSEIMDKIEKQRFMMKQVNTGNRVIPYQLYYYEIEKILRNASGYLPFLNEKDKYGSIAEKILKIMEFRIPYYVGPLVPASKSKNAWLVRKTDSADGKEVSGKITPWNFDEIVDKNECENAFIRRMTCKCTYLRGEEVLPRYSLLYTKYVVLNEINNLQVNGSAISVECKQQLYNELFMKQRNVTHKKISDFLISKGSMEKEDIISGIDKEIKASLRSYHDFKEFLVDGRLSETEVENIIERITLTTDRQRLVMWLKNNFTKLERRDIQRIARFNYKDFGRLSKKLLEEVEDVDTKSGEIRNPSIINMLWQTNENLMKLLSGRYAYTKQIDIFNKNYEKNNRSSIASTLKDMYISSAVRRAIYRTLAVVKELKKIMGSEPEKIFIEMARGPVAKQKGKRTVSRREQIERLFNECEPEFYTEIERLRIELENKNDGELRSEKLSLYFTQLGRCMYTNEPINIAQIGTKAYDIDHIWPRSRIKDDSIDNKVLVTSASNGEKGDSYPIVLGIQNRMRGFWSELHRKKLISEVKFNRLKRNTPFTEEELAGFISRQLVETRQSTKAIAQILNGLMPDSDIVYVKAGLVSEFRHDFDMLKCREVNDLHHAKDAYLNIVVGNAYDVKFTKNPINFIREQQKYSMKLTSLLKYDIVRNETAAWRGEKHENSTIVQVRKQIVKNNIRFVRYSYLKKGGLFKQNLLRKGNGQISRKAGIFADINKYGGYDKAAVSFFILTKCKKKTTLVPVELHKASSIKNENDLLQYCSSYLGTGSIQILLNGRIIKCDSLWEVNGFRAHLISKYDRNNVVFRCGMQLVLDYKYEKYIKKLSSFCKICEESGFAEPERYDIEAQKNEEIYSILKNKLTETPYKTLMNAPMNVIQNGFERFKELSLSEQAKLLLCILQLFDCNSYSKKDLTSIGGSKNTSRLQMAMSLNPRYERIYIIDQSPTGLLEKRSINLLSL